MDRSWSVPSKTLHSLSQPWCRYGDLVIQDRQRVYTVVAFERNHTNTLEQDRSSLCSNRKTGQNLVDLRFRLRKCRDTCIGPRFTLITRRFLLTPKSGNVAGLNRVLTTNSYNSHHLKENASPRISMLFSTFRVSLYLFLPVLWCEIFGITSN